LLHVSAIAAIIRQTLHKNAQRKVIFGYQCVVISGFPRGVNEIFAFVALTFRDNLSVP